VGEERTCGSGFHRDSSRESKSRFGSKRELNDPVSGRQSAEVEVCLTASSGIRA
jgi:hypothetical protein